jgi:hypothetical protein
MAYTIIKSDSSILATIADGTINTSRTPLGLPGRNFAGWGESYVTNVVRQLENFASVTPPTNPLRGQLWYNTNASTLYICPTDGETNAANWLALTTSSSGSTSTFGNVTVTGTILATTANVTGTFTGNTISVVNATVSGTANIATANIANATVTGPLTANSITSGSTSTAGALTGLWTVTGTGGNVVTVSGGNLVATTGIKSDHYYYSNGVSIINTSSYTDGNVATYLNGAYTGNLGSVTPLSNVATAKLTAVSGGSTINGVWTLASGARLNASYADLAERFEADAPYDAGTVVEIGGTKEVTAVVDDLSDKIFGVVSDTAAYLMNSSAGTDATHPQIAQIGRVNVKVVGPITKGDRLVSAGNGVARAAAPGEATALNVIGRALADKTDPALAMVMSTVTTR